MRSAPARAVVRASPPTAEAPARGVVARWAEPAFRLAVGVSLLSSLVGCKGKPCLGRPADGRPVPDAWQAVMAIPEGAVQCTMESPSLPNARFFDVPAATPAEGASKWDQLLKAKGWTQLPPTKADFDAALRKECMPQVRYAHPKGLRLQVSVSSCSPRRGWAWSSVYYSDAGTCLGVNRYNADVCDVNVTRARCEGRTYVQELPEAGVERCKQAGYTRVVLPKGKTVNGELGNGESVIFMRERP